MATITVPDNGSIWAFGDSITAGSWLPHVSDCWVSRVNLRIGGDGCAAITNKGVGGLMLHPGASTWATLEPVVRAALAAGPAPTSVITLIGTNDLTTHDFRAMPDPMSLENSKQAMIAVDVLLQVAGVKKRLWCTILPRGPRAAQTSTTLPTAQPDGWLPELETRRKSWNAWMRAMWGPKGQLIDLDGVLGEDANGMVTQPLLLDGLHPNAWGALLIADAMPRFWQ
jgi:lysophospholipase L1-like esterase